MPRRNVRGRGLYRSDAVTNTVFSGLRFENLDGGLGILGKSNEWPNEKNKQNPLQRSVHICVANCSLAIENQTVEITNGRRALLGPGKSPNRPFAGPTFAGFHFDGKSVYQELGRLK